MRILITGGTSGIGGAIARLCLGAGHSVFVTGRNPYALASFLDGCEPRHRIGGITADAGDWHQTIQAVTAAVHALGGLDAAVANAGFSAPGNLADGDPERWRDMVLTNVYGPAILAKSALPHLEPSRGHFVLMGSTAGRKVYPGNLYTATKWAVTGLTESLRQQVIGSGIRVTLISPGHVQTPLWQEPPDHWMAPESVARTVLWALEQPSDVDVSEIILRATGQEF